MAALQLQGMGYRSSGGAGGCDGAALGEALARFGECFQGCREDLV